MVQEIWGFTDVLNSEAHEGSDSDFRLVWGPQIEDSLTGQRLSMLKPDHAS